ncbi:MAG: NAD(P)-dependent oxidoreductase [Pseudomonadota bacterium]
MPSYRTPRVLLTGASGFLGRAVALDLSRDHTVISLGRTQGPEAYISNIQADLSRRLDLDLLPSSIDAVVHLAQSRLQRDGIADGADLEAINVRATDRLLRFAVRAGAKVFVYASSGNVYGPKNTPASEDDAVAATSDPYTTSKIHGERLVSEYEGLIAATSLRLYALYGPWQKERMIARIISNIANGKSILIQGTGSGLVTQPTYIDDASFVVRTALQESWTGVINVAGPDRAGIKEIAELAADRLQRRAIFEVMPGSSAAIQLPSLERLQKRMPSHRFVPLVDGIARTVDNFRCGSA